MKIAITSTGPDLNSSVDPRFGRCAYFLVIDPETKEFESIENPNISLGGGAGIQSAQLMSEKEVQTVLTGNCGPNAFRTFAAAGIQVVTGVSGSIREALDQFNAGAHRSAASPNVASHFGMGDPTQTFSSPGSNPQADFFGYMGAGAGMGRGMGGGGRGLGRGMGMGRGMRSGMQPAQQDEPMSIDALKEQVRIMEERLAVLKEQIQSEEKGDKKPRLVAHVIADRCNGCRICQDVCPGGCISIVENVAHVDAANCTGCGRCVESCRQEAIALKTA